MKQQAALTLMLSLHCDLYNAALEARQGAWKWEKRRITKFDQFKQLAGWGHSILDFGVTPAQGTLSRLDKAFNGFFRRLKSGQKPGYPRFKPKSRFDSVEYPSRASWKIKNNRLYLQGIGHIRLHHSKRGVMGTPRTLIVKRDGRRWRVAVVCIV